MLACCLLLPLLATRYKRRDIGLPTADYPGNVSASWESTRSGVRSLYQKLLDLAPAVPIVGNVWQYTLQTQHYTEEVHRLAAKLGRSPRVCETGFGSGLSTLGWLLIDKDIDVVTFDWSKDDAGGTDPWFPRRKVEAAKELRKRFGSRWRLVDGDSRQTIPREVEEGLRCDLFHVDGAHIRGGVLADLRHFHNVARESNVLLLDDMQFREIQKGMEDFRLAGGLNLSQCIVTKARDPLFIFPGKTLRKRKVWCQGTFVMGWKPTQQWEQTFEYISGVTASGSAKIGPQPLPTPAAVLSDSLPYRLRQRLERYIQKRPPANSEGVERGCEPPGCDSPLSSALVRQRSASGQFRRPVPLPEGLEKN